MAESNNQNSQNTKSNSLKAKKPITRAKYQEALEKWQEAINDSNNNPQKQKIIKKAEEEIKKLDNSELKEDPEIILEKKRKILNDLEIKLEIKKLIENRDLLLYELTKELSIFYSRKHKIPIENPDDYCNQISNRITNIDLLDKAFSKIFREMNNYFGEENEITIEFLTKNYKKYNNSHLKTVAFIKNRILFAFQDIYRNSKKYISLNNDNPIIKDELDNNPISNLNNNNLEYSIGKFPKILIELNKALLNDYWCIKLPGPNQITSYLLNFLIHSNLDSLFEIFNIDERVRRLIYNVIENRLRENKDKINSEKDKIIQKLPDFNKIINDLRSDKIKISLNRVAPKRNNGNNSINILDEEDLDNYLRKENKKLNNIIDSIKIIMADKNCDPKLVERILHNKREDNRIKVIKEEKYNYFKYFLSKNFERLINTELNTCIQIYQLFYWAFFRTAFADNEETQFRQLFIDKVLENNQNGGENNEQ